MAGNGASCLVRARNHHWKWCHPFWLSTRVSAARAAPSTVELGSHVDGGAGAGCVRVDSLSRVPPLPVVRSRLGLQRAPGWYVRGTTTSSGAESTWPTTGTGLVRARNHHWKWCHPFWLSTRASAARAAPSTVEPGSHVDGGAGLACRRRSRSGLRASRQPSTGATASSRAGVRRRTDSHEAPLEVVAPMGTVDSGVDRSGFALDGEAGAGCVQGDSLPRVPRLLAVRSTTARGPARGPRLYCPNRSCFVAFPRDSSTG